MSYDHAEIEDLRVRVDLAERHREQLVDELWDARADVERLRGARDEKQRIINFAVRRELKLQTENEELRQAQQRDGEAAARCFQRNHDELEAERSELKAQLQAASALAAGDGYTSVVSIHALRRALNPLGPE